MFCNCIGDRDPQWKEIKLFEYFQLWPQVFPLLLMQMTDWLSKTEEASQKEWERAFEPTADQVSLIQSA